MKFTNRTFKTEQIFEILNLATAGTTLTKLQEKYGFTDAQLLVWQGKYLRTKVDGRDPRTDEKRRGYINTRSYHITAPPQVAIVQPNTLLSGSFKVSGHDGKLVRFTLEKKNNASASTHAFHF